ncbi:hypothetical protein PFISCL1PPCAC_1220 [Pristionchus fissidentatus]|uniref:Serpentine receptor class gamma n=1 Tax=Pristionchus fissidentatus TaxID=1538716 RepID=A0AAV5UUM4_9BILA|nr:hypothetical protein PFISCL1PPCAC_1220 [Pristionchus fissidentatus]
MNTTHVIQLIYGLSGVVAYIIVIYAMHGVRKLLHRSFITIFAIMAAINIATWLNTWISIRLLDEPIFYFYYEWVSQHGILRNALNLLIPQLYYAQNICVLLLTADRLAAILAITMNAKVENSGVEFIHKVQVLKS